MAHLSYIIETNGNNGVNMGWHKLPYVPQSFVDESSFPDPEDADAPEYIRVLEDGVYNYYRRAVIMPAKTTAFNLIILTDGAAGNGGFYYIQYSSFFTLTKDGESLNVVSTTNLTKIQREGSVTIVSNQYGETMEVLIVQEYTHLQLFLSSYDSDGVDSKNSGVINAQTFEHRFYWLTSKNTHTDKENIKITVFASGPRNGFVVRDVKTYAYVGELDDRYVYNSTNGKYYETVQQCSPNGVLPLKKEVVYNTYTEGVYKEVDYMGDLKITTSKDVVEITSYGRCFLESDAYYVVTLANVDDLSLTNTITIRYENEEP